MLLILFSLNRREIAAVRPYVLVGALMWPAVLKSGVHVTLAGLALALFRGADWLQILGVSALCGIGFTMSLFIAGLAFEYDAVRLAIESPLAILGGSVISGLAGYLILRHALARR